MSRGVNKAIIVGRLGKDPETRYLPNGKAVTNISLATSEQWNDKQSGDRMEKTEWHNIVAFEKTAEIIAEYCRKGDQLYVEGKLQTRKWQDKEGNDRYTTEIVAQQITLLGGGSGSREDAGDQRQQPRNNTRPAQSQSRGGQPAQTRGGQQQRQPARNASQQRPAREPAPADADQAFDDDIPFG